MVKKQMTRIQGKKLPQGCSTVAPHATSHNQWFFTPLSIQSGGGFDAPPPGERGCINPVGLSTMNIPKGIKFDI